jgi:hypothetical protein
VALLYLSLVSIAALLQGRSWLPRFEALRWGVTAATAALFFVGR